MAHRKKWAHIRPRFGGESLEEWQRATGFRFQASSAVAIGETVNQIRKRKLDESGLDCSDSPAITCIEEWMRSGGEVPAFDSFDSRTSATIAKRASLALNVFKSMMYPNEAEILLVRTSTFGDSFQSVQILSDLLIAVTVKFRELFLAQKATIMPLCLQDPRQPLRVVSIEAMIQRLSKDERLGIRVQVNKLQTGIPGSSLFSHGNAF